MHATAAQQAPSAAAGGLTILRATSGRIATKRFIATRDGRVRKSGYGNERWFALEPAEAGNIFELAALLRRLEHDPHAFLIRGVPLPDANRRRARRLLHADPGTGDVPTIASVDRCWVMIDLDGIACPVGLDPRVPDDGEELIDYLSALLPPEFHDASCYWQWSASQGVPERLGGDPPDQLRAHLFFWLDRAVPDGELRRWAARLKRAGLPVDPAVFAPVQPHYIAAPVLDGLPDPLSRRSGFRERSVDAVPLVLPPADPPEDSADKAHDYDGSGLEFHLGRIGPEGYQAPIKATIAAFFAEHGADADAAPVKADIRTRIAEASGEYPRTPLEIERYRSERFLDDKIAWTRARERAAGAAASAACASLPPCFGDEAPDRDAVLAAQRVAIREWLTRNHGIARARREIARRRRQALGDAGIVEDPPDFNRESREIRRRKAAITHRVRGEVLAELGLERLPRQGERTLVTGAQGTGKSRAVAESIAQMEGIVVLRWLVPTLEKAEEQAQEYHRLAGPDSLSVRVVRGRGAYDPEDSESAMCPRHKVVNRAAAMGVEVQTEICDSCHLKHACGYQRQRRELGDAAQHGGVFVTSADYLWLPCPAPRADIVIVDESIIGKATESVSLDPRRVTEDDKWAGGELGDALRRREVASLVRSAITEHRTRELAFLRDRRVTLNDLKAALKHLASREDARPTVHGRMTDHAIARALDAVEARETRKVLLLFRQVRREFEQPRARLNSVWFEPKSRVVIDGEVGFEPRIFAGYMRAHRLADSTPVLALDGTGSLALNRQVFGERMVGQRFPVPRSAEVVQVTGKLFSRQSLTGTGRRGHPIGAAKFPEAERLRGHLLALLRTLPGPVLLVTYKAVDEILQPLLPPHVRSAHFGAVRGLNTFETCETVVILGREQPGAAAIEALARPFAATDPEPLIPFGGYAKQCRARRLRGPGACFEIVEVHPDPRCQEILEQVREAEIVQAVDRVRPAFHRRRIILLTHLPVDVTVDRVLPWADLRPSRFMQVFARHGVLPLCAADLARCFPDLWGSECVARKALQRAGLRGDKPQIIESIWTLSPLICSYRRRGRRGSPARALVRADLSNPRAELETLVGPLTGFVLHERPRAPGGAFGAGGSVPQPPPPGDRHETVTHT